MESDEDDFVFYGTPIEREEEAGSRKSKAVAEASGQLRTLPAWKQEVRDEEGRRRFHGAFTGGFSAGYFNSVGSKEGWAPQAFVSSRKNRAEVKQQSILNFLDDDEKEDLEGQSLGASSQFDTFGFTAQELARKQADKEQQQRPSAIPGPAPDEIVLPATESIGVKLLLKMGWRRGRSIKESQANSISDSRREARKAFLAFSSSDINSQTAGSESVVDDHKNYPEQLGTGGVPTSQITMINALPPKQDLYGLGFDPYKNAPEFRERKRSRMGEKTDPRHKKAHSMQNNLFGFKSGNVAPGFGIGALEELDAEDEDVFGSGYNFEETYVLEIDEPSTKVTVDSKQKLITNERGVVPGFRRASNAEYQPERFDPPLVPKDFVPRHKFDRPLDNEVKVTNAGPPEVSPPEDNNLKVLIDGVATLVARCGKLFEDLSREKNHANPLFSFLLGGNGHDYYAWKLWEARQKRPDQAKNEFDGKVLPGTQKLSAESRGNILGERPLERSAKEASAPIVSSDSIQLQYNLSDTFMKPATLNKPVEISKPFNNDPAKQERFEKFLKQKYEGGLRTTGFGGASNMSEAERARERLDFEAAAEAMEKQNWGKEINNSAQHITDYLAGGMQFTAGGLQKAEGSHTEDSMKKKMYPKREEFQWRPAPVLCKRFDLIDPYMGKPPPAPRIRSKIDTLIFTADSVKAKGVDFPETENRVSFAKPQSDTRELSIEEAEKEVEPDVQVENVERPVDLYKAIFSDDSEDEASDIKKDDHQEKKVEAANTALSRLMAGDFLESLGKELGLEVPPDPPYSSTTTKPVVGSSPQKPDLVDKPFSSTQVNDQPSSEKPRDSDRKVRTRYRSSSSDSSSEDDERRGRQSRRHRHRSSDDSDSGDRSRSRRKREKSSREKSRSERKHHKHCRRDRESRGSPSRSRHSESRRDKHKKRS